jgi:hypothetical protein
MKESEYNRLKVEIATDYRRKLEALEMVWKMSGGVSRNDSEAANTIMGKGALLKAVRQSLADMDGDFTLHDVEARIRLNNPSLTTALKRPSLSSALKRLEKDSEITLVSRGRGKRASIYRKVPDG